MQTPELYILRHGQTVWNAEDRMQGWANSPLTEAGQMQALRQGEILRSRDVAGFDAWSSPSGRAFQTAGLAVAPLIGTVHTDPRLREIGVGQWTGALRRDLPVFEGADAWIAHYENAPEGEGFAALEARCRAFLADLTRPAVLVTHGITSRMIRSIVIGSDDLGPGSVGGGQGVVYHLKDGAQTLLQ